MEADPTDATARAFAREAVALVHGARKAERELHAEFGRELADGNTLILRRVRQRGVPSGAWGTNVVKASVEDAQARTLASTVVGLNSSEAL